MKKVFIIDEETLIKLIASDWELNNLYNYGVDNWEGMYEISDDDRFTKQDIEKYIKENFTELEGEK